PAACAARGARLRSAARARGGGHQRDPSRLRRARGRRDPRRLSRDTRGDHGDGGGRRAALRPVRAAGPATAAAGRRRERRGSLPDQASDGCGRLPSQRLAQRTDLDEADREGYMLTITSEPGEGFVTIRPAGSLDSNTYTDLQEHIAAITQRK